MMGVTGASPVRSKRSGSPLQMVLVTFLALIAIVYGVTAMSTGTLLWAVPTTFETRPLQIELYHEGQKTVLTPGDPDYEALTTELNQQINRIEGYYHVSPRPATVAESLARSTAVRVAYARPIEIRTRWNLGEPTHIWIPVTGPNSNANLIYTGVEDRFGHGGLYVEDLEPFYAMVKARVGRE